MNKICGYSCEHNKGGVCQITRCIKMPLFTTTTDEPLRQQISNFQKENGVKVDDNLSLKKLYEENIKYKEVLDKIKEKLEKDNKEAVDFTHKIETSDLQQGSYPVHYYRMLWNKELTEKYLELLEEIE